MIKSPSSPASPQHLANPSHYTTANGSSAINGRSSPNNSMSALVNHQQASIPQLQQPVDLEMLTKTLKKDRKFFDRKLSFWIFYSSSNFLLIYFQLIIDMSKLCTNLN